MVSTPIGNLGDFSFRAIETLKSVALILAEDTRHSRRLLDHYDIEKSMTSYHEHNEARTTPRLVQRLVNGDDLALITDAGTPLLSDPGQRLVQAAIAAGVTVVPIPGASALRPVCRSPRSFRRCLGRSMSPKCGSPSLARSAGSRG